MDEEQGGSKEHDATATGFELESTLRKGTRLGFEPHSMGKKKRGKDSAGAKDDVPSPTSITNRDILQRLNFLYQAGAYLNGVAAAHTPAPTSGQPSSPSEDHGVLETDLPAQEERGTKEKAGKGQQAKASTERLVRSYMKSMRIIGQKTNVRM